jgi:DNA polymerase V
MNSHAIPVGVPLELTGLSLVLTLAGDVVKAGFPSPALDFPGERIDLIKTLVTHPQATFLLRVSGDSMRDAGIFDDDVLVVNRALRPRHGHVVVAQVDGDFCVKYLYQRGGRVKLRAANVTYPDIIPAEGQTLEVFGVVTSCIKQFKV